MIRLGDVEFEKFVAAFPFVCQDHSKYQTAEPGMGLRDWFAGLAMAAIVSHCRLNPCGDFVATDCLLQHYKAPDYAASTAYKFADAMMREGGYVEQRKGSS